jgi:hypothetical protein
MARHALFPGLVFDEQDRPLEVGQIGSEAAYVIDDAGFRRHIPSDQIDRAVLAEVKKMIEGNEELLSAQTAKMLGAEDLFSRAIIEQQLKHVDRQFDLLFEAGIPEEMRAYLGMVGFKVIVNYHGEVIEVRQASGASDRGE